MPHKNFTRQNNTFFYIRCFISYLFITKIFLKLIQKNLKKNQKKILFVSTILKTILKTFQEDGFEKHLLTLEFIKAIFAIKKFKLALKQTTKISFCFNFLT